MCPGAICVSGPERVLLSLTQQVFKPKGDRKVRKPIQPPAQHTASGGALL